MNTVNIGPCKLYYGSQDDMTYLGCTESGVTITVAPLSYSEKLDQQNYDSNHVIIYQSGIISTTIAQINLLTLNLLLYNTDYADDTSIETLSFSNNSNSISVLNLKALKLESMLDDEAILCHYVYPIININTTFQYELSGFDINFHCYNYNNQFIDFS